MYLREMGGVELLSREGEIAIAKRIEAGKDVMINALTQRPLVANSIFHWKDELEKNDELQLTNQTQAQLNHAIDTIHVNMRQLLEQLTAYQEENSLIHQEARELEEILSAVLQWQNEEGE